MIILSIVVLIPIIDFKKQNSVELNIEYMMMTLIKIICVQVPQNHEQTRANLTLLLILLYGPIKFHLMKQFDGKSKLLAFGVYTAEFLTFIFLYGLLNGYSINIASVNLCLLPLFLLFAIWLYIFVAEGIPEFRSFFKSNTLDT